MSFKNLLAVSTRMVSGNQQIQTFQPPWNDFNPSLRLTSKASSTEMNSCLRSAPSRSSQSSTPKYAPSSMASRHVDWCGSDVAFS